jgi:hypothetical protein
LSLFTPPRERAARATEGALRVRAARDAEGTLRVTPKARCA